MSEAISRLLEVFQNAEMSGTWVKISARVYLVDEFCEIYTRSPNPRLSNAEAIEYIRLIAKDRGYNQLIIATAKDGQKNYTIIGVLGIDPFAK